MLTRGTLHVVSPAPFQLCHPCHARIRLRILLLNLEEARRPFRHASYTTSRPFGLIRAQARLLSTTGSFATSLEDSRSVSEHPPNPQGRYSLKPTLQAQQLLQLLHEDPTTPVQQDHTRKAIEAQVEVIRQAEQRVPKDDEAIWKAFQELKTLSHGGNLSYLPKMTGFMQSCRDFTFRSTDNWLKDPSSGHVEDLIGPPLRPSELIVFFESLEIHAKFMFPTLLWKLAKHIVENPDASTTTGIKHMQELTTLWSLAFALRKGRLPRDTSDEPSMDNVTVPSADTPQPPSISSKKAFRTTLEMALRPVLPEVAHYYWPNYESAAILTLALLLREVKPRELSPKAIEAPKTTGMDSLRQFLDAAVRRDCKPWIIGPLHLELNSQDLNVRRRYEDVMAGLNLEGLARSHSPPSAVQGDEFTGHVTGLSQMRRDKFTTEAHNHLSRSVKNRDRTALKRVTGQILEASRNKLYKVDDGLFERAVLAHYEMRDPKAAVHVYEAFLAQGRPTLGMYRALMQGAGKIRDYSAAEQYWRVMRSHGIQPDSKAWGIRIFTLTSGGHLERGMDALKEMGAEWLRAAQHRYAVDRKRGKEAPKISGSTLVNMFPDDIDGVPRPNITVANGAISGLMPRRGGPESIPKVLAWCSSFSIKPDNVTFNSLLNLCVREGDLKEAMALLSRMESEGIKADSNMWTILLTNLVEDGSLDGLTQEKQHETVMAFMSSLESVSHNSIDTKGYATVIDRMLKRYDNPETAKAVLMRMTDRGLEPTPMIYTILMTRYFQDSNLPAVESLWNHIQAQRDGRGAALDHWFYDRMIEGYASHHNLVGLQPTFAFINHMLRTNRKPSWYTLRKVAEALTDRRDWSRLNQLVEDVLSWEREGNTGGVHIGEKEFGRHAFWRLCLQTVDLGNPLLDVARAQSILGERSSDAKL